jgi:KUP system potassium uptake protein
VFVPAVNAGLLVIVLAIVIGFGSSAALASAYGVAVTGTFILNTILFLSVARLLWHKPRPLIALGAVVFLTMEFTFFAANLTKIVHGGWLPLAIAALVFTLLMTWRRGHEIVSAKRVGEEGNLRDFIDSLAGHDPPVRQVPGTAVYLNAHPQTSPLALRENVEHNHIIHERVIIVSIQTERVPHVYHADRLTCDELGHADDGITGLTVRFGFQDAQNVPAMLKLAVRLELLEPIDLDGVSYFLSHITIVPSGARGMSAWRKRLFVMLAHNAADPVPFFRLPDDRTVTMGERISL